MSEQEEFITSSITDLLQQAGLSVACLKGGVEAFPVSEYIMQSVFLKMTGFQEQKFKCICWELATIDYEYRYKRVLSGDIGECSDLSEKTKVYQDVVSAIRRYDHDFSLDNFRAGLSLMDEMTVVHGFYDKSRHVGWLDSAYRRFEDFGWSCIEGACLCQTSKGQFFGNCSNCKNKKSCSIQKSGKIVQNLSTVFNDAVYKHRNRCAHNILSYARNKPPLIDLCERHDIEENYFVRFVLLIMIDKIIVSLYERWKTLRLNN